MKAKLAITALLASLLSLTACSKPAGDDVPGIKGWDAMACWDGSDPLTHRDERYFEQ